MAGACLLKMRKSSSYKPGMNAGIQYGYLPNKNVPRLDKCYVQDSPEQLITAYTYGQIRV
jgi:hypothetical protein